MQKYQQNLNRALENYELLRGAVDLAKSPGLFFALGLFVLEAAAGRPVGNIMIACGTDTLEAAGKLGTLLGLKPVPLRDPYSAYYLAGGERAGRALTLVPLSRSGIQGNLAEAGFTVEAMAVDLVPGNRREIIDPFGGLADLEAGRLSAVSPSSFEDDPARILFAAELAAGYGLEIDAGTEASLSNASGLVEFLEPSRAWKITSRLFGGGNLSEKARLLRKSGALEALLPEVGAVYCVPQNYYHHLGVWDHTLEVLDILEEMLEQPAKIFPAFGGRLKAHFKRDVESGVSRRAYIGFAALIHDIGKPSAMTVQPSGRIRFQGHQDAGGELAAGIAARMGLGRRGRRHLAGLVADHMRLGFLLKEGESAESRLRAVRELDDRCIDVIMLSLADRMATRGEASTEESIALYGRMAARVLHDYFWDIDYPPLVGGHDVMMHTGLSPGREVGRALMRARVAQREAIVSNRQQALEFMAPDFKGKMDLRGRIGDGWK